MEISKTQIVFGLMVLAFLGFIIFLIALVMPINGGIEISWDKLMGDIRGIIIVLSLLFMISTVIAITIIGKKL